MSLYHEAAGILDAVGKGQISLKSEVFGKKTWKTDAKTLFALSSEAAKWSSVLSEVVERSGILKLERQLSPTLALVLTHDLLLSKKGIALPARHGLNTLTTRHKARLSAELTKARIRRGFASLDTLRANVNDTGIEAPSDNTDGTLKPFHPRWIRINTLKTTLEDQLATTFAGYERVSAVKDLRNAKARNVYVDDHIPNLVAIPVLSNLNSSKPYRDGMLIFQDKASCFPAYLLDPSSASGDIIDGCAAPGNKTTHVAAILHENQGSTVSKVFACEKDELRSKTLQKMTKLADPEGLIHVKPKQNFLKLNPISKELSNVTAILLDPSCSGSGIVSRDEGGIVVHLPSTTAEEPVSKKGKKRKLAQTTEPEPAPVGDTVESLDDDVQEEAPDEATKDGEELKKRITALADFQLRLLKHAMTFPSAARITYSTCSIHDEENEKVVVRALASPEVREAGWRMLRRGEQVDGMKRWNRRGELEAVAAAVNTVHGADRLDINRVEVAQACLRCDKSGDEGTMGFFVAGFVRDGSGGQAVAGFDRDVREDGGEEGEAGGEEGEDEGKDEEEWSGFGDD